MQNTQNTALRILNCSININIIVIAVITILTFIIII